MGLPKYVHLESEPGLWTVGFYDPSGKWHPYTDYNDEKEAVSQVRFLNGGEDPDKADQILRAQFAGQIMAAVMAADTHAYYKGEIGDPNSFLQDYARDAVAAANALLSELKKAPPQQPGTAVADDGTLTKSIAD